MSIHASCATWESSWRVMCALSPEKNRHKKSDDLQLDSRGRCDVCFSGGDLPRWCAKEGSDRKSDDAADKNKPRPGNLRPPIRHEPSEVPLRSHEFSPQ